MTGGRRARFFSLCQPSAVASSGLYTLAQNLQAIALESQCHGQPHKVNGVLQHYQNRLEQPSFSSFFLGHLLLGALFLRVGFGTTLELVWGSIQGFLERVFLGALRQDGPVLQTRSLKNAFVDASSGIFSFSFALPDVPLLSVGEHHPLAQHPTFRHHPIHRLHL
jgi:hypothetical protein